MDSLPQPKCLQVYCIAHCDNILELSPEDIITVVVLHQLSLENDMLAQTAQFTCYTYRMALVEVSAQPLVAWIGYQQPLVVPCFDQDTNAPGIKFDPEQLFVVHITPFNNA